MTFSNPNPYNPFLRTVKTDYRFSDVFDVFLLSDFYRTGLLDPAKLLDYTLESASLDDKPYEYLRRVMLNALDGFLRGRGIDFTYQSWREYNGIINIKFNYDFEKMHDSIQSATTDDLKFGLEFLADDLRDYKNEQAKTRKKA